MIELKDREYDPETKEIFFNVYKDGVETVWIVVFDKGEELHLGDIFPLINSSSSLGVVGVRQLIRALKKEFPRVTKLSMSRFGGAKHLIADNEYDEESHSVEWKM
jgi:hypothetical protein